jgi:hypothetical protein
MSKPQLPSMSRWLPLLSSVLLLQIVHQANARCSHGVAERGLATHKAILAAREAQETELHQHQIGGISKRQNPPTSLEQQVNILGPLTIVFGSLACSHVCLRKPTFHRTDR